MSKFVAPQLVVLYLVLFVYFFVLRLGQGFYIDDIAYLMQSSRFLEENFRLWWWFPQCRNSFSFEIPYIWYIPAIFRSILGRYFTNSIGGVDVFACLRATFAVFVSTLLVGRTLFEETENKNLLKVFFVTAALFLSGTTPFYLAMIRPETALYIVLVISMYTSLTPKSTSPRYEFALACFQLCLFLWGVSLHAQIVVFAPVFALGIFLRKNLNVKLRFFLLGLFILIPVVSWQTFQVWGTCPGNPATAAFLDFWSVSPSDFSEDINKGIDEVVRNLSSLIASVGVATFQDTNFGMLLANRDLPSSITLGVNAIIATVEMLGLLTAALLAMCAFVQLCFRYREASESYLARLLLGTSLFVCFVAWGSLRGKNYYLAHFLHAIPILVILLLWTKNDRTSILFFLRTRLQDIVFAGLLMLLPLSFLMNLYLYSGFSYYSSYLLPETRKELVFYRTREVRNHDSMSELIKTCGLNELSADTPVIIEDPTYFALRDRTSLVHALFIANLGENDFVQTQEDIWYLLPCGRFREFQNNRVAKSGDFCCGRASGPAAE